MFQHTAARRRLGMSLFCHATSRLFQHTAARRRLVLRTLQTCLMFGFNTQPPEGGWERPERAASRESCFNTQPPEGGWPSTRTTHSRQNGFNTQPPEGGWHQIVICRLKSAWFQHTAARRRLEPLSKALLHQVSQPRFR